MKNRISDGIEGSYFCFPLPAPPLLPVKLVALAVDDLTADSSRSFRMRFRRVEAGS